jgi:hypothetical protein
MLQKRPIYFVICLFKIDFKENTMQILPMKFMGSLMLDRLEYVYQA